ncbi:MAG: ABC transporter ATP-binding protein [Acidobacteriota bacterium]
MLRSKWLKTAEYICALRVNSTVLGHWCYLPKFLCLLWRLGSREIMLMAVFALVSGLMPFLNLIILRRAIDNAVGVANGNTALTEAGVWLSALLITNLLQELINSIVRWIGDDVQERLKARLQKRLLEKASRLPLVNFEEPTFYDKLQRAQQGLDTRLFSTIENLFPIPSLLVTAVSLLLYVGSAHLLFPIILLVGLLPLHISSLHSSLKQFLLDRKQTADTRMLNYLSELMINREAAAEIRLFGLQEYLLKKRQQLFSRLRDERLGMASTQARSLLRSALVEQLTYGSVILGVVMLILRGRLSIGHFAAYLSAAERFRDSVSTLLAGIGNIHNDLRYIGDLLDYLDMVEEQVNSHTEIAARSIEVSADIPEIRFEDVSFHYAGSDRPVLAGVNLLLHPREHVALVGQNGAGKTTLAKLLLGLYRPTIGRITVDGVELSQIDLDQWRNRVTAVFQDFVRYELTVKENIGFGDLRQLHNNDAIQLAAAKSSADAVAINLPLAYETPLGSTYFQEGQQLSMGQWQKLAIARAYLRDAAILVLDEPTASLDARAEAEIYHQFHRISRGRSVLFISHRLASARLADRILFLEDGQIVEEGAHNQLIESNQRYAHLYASQAALYQSSGINKKQNS